MNIYYYNKNGKKINQKHKNITGKISKDLRGDVTDLQGDVTGLSGDVTNLYGDVSGLRGNISSCLRGDVTDLRGDVTGLSGYVTDLYGNVTDLHGYVTSLRGDVTGLRGDIQEKIKTLYIWKYPISIIKDKNLLQIGCEEYKLDNLPSYKDVKDKISKKRYYKIKNIIKILIKE